MFQGDIPANDPRTTDELISFALNAADDDERWDAIRSLHWRGGHEVLECATQLTTGESPNERRLGADILGQPGVPESFLPDQCKIILKVMLSEGEDAGVLKSVLIALSNQNDIDAIPQVVKFSMQPDSDVRHASVHALSGHEVPLAIETLIQLSNDTCDHVRDWAIFSLGTLIEIDTPQIREALAARLHDPHDDTRAEAIVGLAQRKDFRVVAALKSELDSDCIGTLVIEAAELIASDELYSQLVDLREWWDVAPELLERAIDVSKR